MKSTLVRGCILGCLVACLGAATAGCSESEDGAAPPPPTDLQRGTMAATREHACGVENWKPLTVHESLGIFLSVFPGGHKRGVDCTLAAHNCQEVEACMAYYLIDDEQYADLHLPECGSEPTDHCEGNVIKYCVSDDYKTWYEASYDCALAGGTCVEFQDASGEHETDCQAPVDPCKGHETPYCDGTRAVLCEKTYQGLLSPWIYDCADAWGSQCVYDNHGEVTCEGPGVSSTVASNAGSDAGGAAGSGSDVGGAAGSGGAQQ